MILRAVLATWIYFQVVTIIKWDLTFYIQGHQVLSQFSKEEITPNTRYAMFEGNELERSSACAACDNITDTGRRTNAQCEISEDFLQTLYDLVLEAFDKIQWGFRSSRTRSGHRKYAKSEDSCDGLVDNCRNSSLLPPAMIYQNTHESNEDCEALLEEMEDKMRFILEQLELLIEVIDDPEFLRMKISQLQNCVQCLEETIDVIVKQATIEIAECYEASLGQVNTCFATQLNEKTRKIQELETMVTNKTINVIVSNVLASKYVDAAIEYRDLRNESLFDSMMRDLYKSRQLEHILHFGRALYHNNITGRAAVYMKLVELMKDSQTIDTQDVIFSSFVTRDRLEYCKQDNFCFTPPENLPLVFAELARYIKPKVDNVVDRWSVNIRNNNYKAILLFGSPAKVNFSGKAFHDVMDSLITKSYDKNSNYLDGTLNFASELLWNNQSYTAFKCLLREASRFEDQLKIAFKMKEKMEHLTGPDEQATVVRRQFDDLRNNLLDNIRGLVWQEICTLRDKYGSYAMTGGSFFEGGNRKIYFVSNPSGSSSYHKWKFERVEGTSGKEYEFKILSVAYNQYLGSHIPWKFSQRNWEYCAVSKPDHIEAPRKYYNWQVHYNGVANKVFLYHVGRRAYMDTAHMELDMSGRRTGEGFTISCEK